jgi:hypothetical protein
MIRHIQDRYMQHNFLFLFLLGISLAFTACTANAPEQPTPEKTYIEIIAVVYEIDTSPDGTLLRVRQLDKQLTTPEYGGVVMVTEASEVVNKIEGKEKKATPQFLAVGQKISVFAETLQESIPWVARAVKVEVLTSGTLETGDPILQGLNPDLTGRYQGLKKITVDGVEHTLVVVDSVKLDQFPQVTEINLVPSNQMTVWRLAGKTYREVDLDSLIVGKRISVLLTDWLGYPGDYPIDGVILEIIIRDE